MTSQKPRPFSTAESNFSRLMYLPRRMPSMSKPPTLILVILCSVKRDSTALGSIWGLGSTLCNDRFDPLDFVHLVRQGLTRRELLTAEASAAVFGLRLGTTPQFRRSPDRVHPVSESPTLDSTRRFDDCVPRIPGRSICIHGRAKVVTASTAFHDRQIRHCPSQYHFASYCE